MKQTMRAFVAGLVAALIASGCGGTAPQGGQALKKVQIGAVMFARDIEYWKLVEAGMNAAAKKENVQLQVAVSNRNLATESQVVDQLIARGDNVLVISPLDKNGSKATLQRAVQAGMTVVQFNTRVDDPSLKYFVGVDNRALGASSGKFTHDYIQNTLGGSAKIGIETGGTTPGGPDRQAGFTSAISDLPNAQIIAQAEVHAPDQGANAFQTMLQAHPDINVVWCWNGSALSGSATIAKKIGAKVKLFGVDMSQDVAADLLDPASPVEAVADQHAYQIGQTAVEQAIKAARGEKMSDQVSITPVIYSKQNPSLVNQWLNEVKQESAS